MEASKQSKSEALLVSEVAIFASGNGSNFEAVTKGVRESGHGVACLVYDRIEAKVVERASLLGVPSHYVSYFQRDRSEAESEILSILDSYSARLLVLAGFMRILSANFVDAYPRRIVNIHPALLPAHPGLNAIETSFRSADTELGITIHFVDDGIDSGPVIRQASFTRNGTESLEEITDRIHGLEHSTYPLVLVDLLHTAAAGSVR